MPGEPKTYTPHMREVKRLFKPKKKITFPTDYRRSNARRQNSKN